MGVATGELALCVAILQFFVVYKAKADVRRYKKICTYAKIDLFFSSYPLLQGLLPSPLPLRYHSAVSFMGDRILLTIWSLWRELLTSRTSNTEYG